MRPKTYLRGEAVDRHGPPDVGLGPRPVAQQRLDGEVLPLWSEGGAVAGGVRLSLAGRVRERVGKKTGEERQ